MDKIFVLGVLHVWLAAIIYSWIKNRNGSLDRSNYNRFAQSRLWRWMVMGRSREAFLRQQRLLHRLALQCAICFYMLAIWGILYSP